MPSRERKQVLFEHSKSLLGKYNKILVLGANNVGSKQIQQIRMALRGKALLLFGKNTMHRLVVKTFVKENGGDHPMEELLPLIKGNVGYCFTNGDIGEVRQIIEENRVPAAARAGQIAESDVVVPAGPTGCDPGQTSWFQALNVPTKISRGQIEIVSDLKLVTKGEIVGGSEAALLQKLDIKPFTYGLVLQSVYDNGTVFDAKVLDITENAMKQKFFNAVRRMASYCLVSGYPTLASIPHSIGNGVRTLIAVSAASGYSFEQMEEWDKLLNMDPEELAKLAAAAAASGGAGDGGAGGEEAKEEEEEEEEVDVGGGGLFGGDDDGY